MKLALNGATIMHSPLADDVEIAAACGYDALEIWAGKLPAYLESRTLDDLRERMRALGVVPWCINSIEDITFRDSAGRRALLEELRLRLTMASTLRAPSIVVVPTCLASPVSRRRAIAETVEVLRLMSDVAGDTALAFEFLGKPGCTVPTLDMAIEVVELVDRRNVGMVLDTFHFYAGDSDFEHLSSISMEKLIVVHINGAEALPKHELTDAHRLYPGEGVVPAAEILGVLLRRGYDGVASVEIFRPQYWEQNPRHVASEAFLRATALLHSAQLTTQDS